MTVQRTKAAKSAGALRRYRKANRWNFRRAPRLINAKNRKGNS